MHVQGSEIQMRLAQAAAASVIQQESAGKNLSGLVRFASFVSLLSFGRGSCEVMEGVGMLLSSS